MMLLRTRGTYRLCSSARAAPRHLGETQILRTHARICRYGLHSISDRTGPPWLAGEPSQAVKLGKMYSQASINPYKQ